MRSASPEAREGDFSSPRIIILSLLGLALAVGPARADVGSDVDPPPSRKAVVVVMPFTSPTPYSGMGRSAQETFITQLVNTQRVRVVQATEVNRMLKRRGLHWTGTIDPQLLKAAGNWLKADYMMTGKLRFGGDAYVLSVHVVNVKSLETTMAEDVDFSDVSKMRIAVRVAAKKIAVSVSGGGRGGGDGGSKADLFLNTDARAFYDTSDACVYATEAILRRYSFSGTIDSTDEETKTVRVKGYAGSLALGVPLDIYSTSGIDEPQKVATVYLIRKIAGGFEAQYRGDLQEGIELGAKITTSRHRWTVAVGKVEDEVEDNELLVKRFRHALLEKISEGKLLQEMEGGGVDYLARLSDRRTRPTAFQALHARGVDMVLEGRFYGGVGSRRAHFKIFSTFTGKVIAEPKFETRL
jgi:TolB-like protein